MTQLPITHFLTNHEPMVQDTHDQDVPGEDVEAFFQIGPHVVTVVIYLYRCARTGNPVYVGQTAQTLEQRDGDHLNTRGAPGSFDHAYTDRNLFTLERLDVQSFEADVTCRAQYRALCDRAGAWADARETGAIAYFGTYDETGLGTGRNRTRGGQHGALRATMESNYIASCRRWANVYRPELEAYLAEHGSLRDIPQRHPTLGGLTRNIRSGHTNVPPAHMAWLQQHGFVMDHYAAIWEQDYMPAFRAYLAEHGSLRDIPRSHPTLGQLTSSIRYGNTSVPPAHMAWLQQHGFVMEHRAAIWEQDYMPAFRAYLTEHGSLRDIPVSHPTLGRLTNTIRTGELNVPPEHMAWLQHNGFVMDYRAAVWEQDYMPAFRAYFEEHGSLRDIPRSHPTLGRRTHSIRSGNTSVPPEHKPYLQEHGFRWSTKNVAAHVAGYLGLERASLPAAATEAAPEVLHCLREAARLELFGRLSLEQLIVRYNDNRARL
jgi:hypothetical protein